MKLSDIQSQGLKYFNKAAGVEISVEDLEYYDQEELRALAEKIRSEIAFLKSAIAQNYVRAISGQADDEEKRRLKASSKKMEAAKCFKEAFFQQLYHRLRILEKQQKAIEHNQRTIEQKTWERLFVWAAKKHLSEDLYQQIFDEATAMHNALKVCDENP